MSQLKKIEIIIPHRWLTEIDDLLKGMQIGGLSTIQIEGRGKVKLYLLQLNEVPELQPQSSYQEQK